MEISLKKKLGSRPSFSYHSLPKHFGIYLFLDKEDSILYVGKAKDLRNRVSSYFIKRTDLGEKTRILISKIAKVKAIPVASEVEALLLEARFIKKHKPRYNIRLTDGKAYPLIRITKDPEPKVLIARRQDDNPPAGGSRYFGPFPNSGALRLVLKTVRRIFPFQSVLNHSKRICLYHHLGLCPCPPMFDSKQQTRDYRKNIRHLTQFLNGNTKKVLQELTKERDDLSKDEEFEKANLFQKKIDAIELITTGISKTFDYDTNPNLLSDLRRKEISSLRNILIQNNIAVNTLHRIECYDISNISGAHATGSLVVFTDGEKDSRWYRRFKIRLNKGPDDFAMMEEVLRRRMKHKEWPMPDLIIVDGGKGQVSAALNALTIEPLNNRTMSTPVIGLAKREETIITSDLKEISLPKNSEALKLLMRIRDEAHRFAITYHRKLRSKNALFNL